MVITVKVWRLTLLNLKKRKSTSISLLLLIFLATLFLCVGLNVMTGVGLIYESNQKKLQEPDNCYICSQDMYRRDYYDFVAEHELTQKAECIKVIEMTSGEIPYADGTIASAFIFQRYGEECTFFENVFQDEIEVSGEKAIYVPEAIKQYGFQTGDLLTISYKGNNYEFRIAGYFQTTCFGIINTGGLRFYLKEEDYETLQQEIGESYAILAATENHEDSYELDMALRDYIRKNADSMTKTEIVSCYNALEAESAYSMVGMVLAAILIGFSIVIVLICFLVIRFRIQNTIETGMVQIGTLEALGYTAREVILVYVLEYAFLSGMGALLGVIANYGVLPMFGKALEGIYGLSWQSFGHLGKDVCCVIFGILFSTGLSFQIARQIYRYAPVTALSGGVKSHSFRKNHFPLHKGRFLQARMGLKEMSMSIRQNVTVLLCITGVTFLTMLGVYLYVAVAVDRETLKPIIGSEWIDVAMFLNEQVDEQEIVQEVSKMEEVRKVGLAKEFVPIYANDAQVYVDIYDDYDRLETNNVFEGRYPKYEDELVITGTLAERWNKNIGDTVTLEYNGSSADYLIVGLSQTVNNSGNMMKVTLEGIRQLCPTLRLNEVQIYLKEGADKEAFIQKLNQIYGVSAKQASDITQDELEGMSEEERIKRIADEKLAKMVKMYGVDNMDYTVYIDGVMISGNSRKYAADSIQDSEQEANAALSMFASVFGGVAAVILVTTLAIISLMFALLIKMLLVQRKEHFGIMKALGYTTAQLRLQIAISMMPSVLFGTVIGALLNHFLIGKLFSFIMKNLGISRMSFSVSPVICIGMIVLLILYAFFIAMLYAGKVKRITPYELLTE